jgi:hypothetical protein
MFRRLDDNKSRRCGLYQLKASGGGQTPPFFYRKFVYKKSYKLVDVIRRIYYNYKCKQDYTKGLKEMRICDKCGKEMLEGYVIEGGFEYYCSKECLLKEMTWEEFLELYDDGEGDSYWTEWYDEI